MGAVILTTACLVSACSNRPPGYPAPASSSASAPSPAAVATRGGELGSLTARGMVDALNAAGLAVPNPVDTTAKDCPAAHCDQSIATDTLQLKSFPTTATAQSYAEDHALFQTGTIVVAFAPSVRTADQARYRRLIEVLAR